MNISEANEAGAIITLSVTNALTLAEYAVRLENGEISPGEAWIARRTEDNGHLAIYVEHDKDHYGDRESGPAKDILDMPRVIDLPGFEPEPPTVVIEDEP